MSDRRNSIAGLFAGRYAIDREIGRGATATVYLAHEIEGRYPVAIKIINEEIAESFAADRFLREIRLTESLRHPHIAAVRDSGQFDGRLFFVLDYLDGGTVRERLLKEKQLSIPDAAATACSVADALEYAHRLGWIHRDVKPENILFSGGQAWLADFGIARAVERAANESVTTTGLVRGTPAYMSPEQAGGARDYDARSDIFSLGCVLYEMVAGVPAFIGATPQAVIAQRFAHAARPVSVYRASVPIVLERVIEKAMQISPADRYATAAEFADAIRSAMASDEIRPTSARTPRRFSRRLVGTVAVVAGVTLAVALRVHVGMKGEENLVANLDTTRLALFPIDRSGAPASVAPEPALYEAISRWNGVTLVDAFQVTDEIRRHGQIATDADARRTAIALGAGRYVRGQLSDVGGVYRLSASLYDVKSGDVMHRATVRIDRDWSGSDRMLRALADSLILGQGVRASDTSLTASHSAPAVQAFAAAFGALDGWNLERADSLLEASLNFDPTYYRAVAWLAQVRAWRGQDSATWGSLARLAVVNSHSLSERERSLTTALSVMASGDYRRACVLYDELVRQNGRDFAAWYGAGQCRYDDHVVVHDPRSASGWRFRSSTQRALVAFARAFELLPTVHQSFQRGAYARLRDLLFTGSAQLRFGVALAPDTLQFFAYPDLQSDTLVFVPQLMTTVASGGARPAGFEAAVQRQRRIFNEIAHSWVAALPHSAGAKEALAISLEMLGDAAAIDTLRAARELADNALDKLRLSSAEILLRLQFNLSGVASIMRGVRHSADSLLNAFPDPSSSAAELLAPIATLAGRCETAATLEMRSAEPFTGAVKIPASLRGSANALLVRNAMGCANSDPRARVDDIAARIAQIGPPPQQRFAEQVLLVRPMRFAYPHDGPWIRRFAMSTGDYLLSAQSAALSGDVDGVRRSLAQVSTIRATSRPSDVQPDAMYPEMVMLIMTADTASAMSRLDELIGAARSFAPTELTHAVGVASVIRCVILRALLSAERGDLATARRWSEIVSALWSDSDAAATHDVQQLLRLVKS